MSRRENNAALMVGAFLGMYRFSKNLGIYGYQDIPKNINDRAGFIRAIQWVNQYHSL